METRLLKNSKWVLLRNVFKAIFLFKHHEAYVLTDLNELISELEAIPTDKSYKFMKTIINDHSPYNIALKDLRKCQNFEKLVQRGSSEDIRSIIHEIQQDPYMQLKNADHPFAIINRRNSQGQTPLYVACKNGNFELVSTLLLLNADHLLTSKIDGEQETCLEVAIRWMHYNVVKLLLSKNWGKNDFKKAKRMSRTKEMVQLFESFSKEKSKFFCCVRKN